MHIQTCACFAPCSMSWPTRPWQAAPTPAAAACRRCHAVPVAPPLNAHPGPVLYTLTAGWLFSSSCLTPSTCTRRLSPEAPQSSKQDQCAPRRQLALAAGVRASPPLALCRAPLKNSSVDILLTVYKALLFLSPVRETRCYTATMGAGCRRRAAGRGRSGSGLPVVLPPVLQLPSGYATAFCHAIC